MEVQRDKLTTMSHILGFRIPAGLPKEPVSESSAIFEVDKWFGGPRLV